MLYIAEVLDRYLEVLQELREIGFRYTIQDIDDLEKPELLVYSKEEFDRICGLLNIKNISIEYNINQAGDNRFKADLGKAYIILFE